MSAELASERVAGDSSALSALASQVADRPAVCLEQVLSVAQLTARLDLKYLVPREALPGILDHLPHQLAALDIDGRRIFGYESVYFDTEGFALYRHHVQGRRRRYKTRIRSRDTSDAMFEVKPQGSAGPDSQRAAASTLRAQRRVDLRGSLFLDTVVPDASGVTVPTLWPALTTTYRRATLVDLERRSRVTIDVNLSWFHRESSQQADHLALIETKSLLGPGPVDALLGSMGVRPVRISKYCLGVALLHPDTAANPWNRLLRHQFGWQRATESDPVVAPRHRRTTT